MTSNTRAAGHSLIPRKLVAVWCAAMLVPGETIVWAEDKAPAPAPSATPPPANPSAPPAAPAPTPAASAGAAPADAKTAATAPAAKGDKDNEDDKPLNPDQLDSLVAPIALYPDPLLAQTLVASTYPLEIVQLNQWMAKNKNLKDEALAEAVGKQDWDPSIQSMAAVPEVVKRLADDIEWTTELGNAFLAQQSEVMDAVQRMRGKAKEKGALASNEQQKVETKVVEEKTVIIVEPTNPEVIYVPSYSPAVVYPPPIYAYPPIYYPPPPPPGAAFVSFSFGVMMGAAIWGGSCCGCGWGHAGNVNINVNNNFNRVNNINGGGNWSHNSAHRGSAPYSNKATASKYGGSTRSQQAAGNRAGAGAGGGANRASAGTSDRAGGGGARGGGPSAGTADRSAGGGSRGSSPSASDRSAGGGGGRSAGTSANQMGSRDMSRSSSSGGGGFGGGSSGFSGSSARASSSRGASSMGSRGGGGGGGGRRR